MAFSNHDVVPDSPINNFATLNPLFVGYASRNNYVSNNGNLQIKDLQMAQSTFTIPEDGRSYYMEAFVDLPSNDGELFIRNQLTTAFSYNSSASQSIGLYYSNGSGGFTGGFVPRENGVAKSPITIIGTPHSSWDLYPYEVVFGVLVSKTNRTLSVQFYANNTLVYQNNSFNFNDDAPAVIAFAGANAPSGKFSVINFGQDHTFGGAKTGGGYQDANGLGQFYYQPPAGALALCTKNIPSGPINIANDDVPSDYFKAVTYVGDYSSPATISVGFNPDLVWIKQRTPYASQSHCLYDSVRGVSKRLYSDSTSQEITPDGNGGVTNFSDNNGFELTRPTNQAYEGFNSSQQMIAWCFRAGGSPADGQAKIINEDGSDGTMSTADLASAAGGGANMITPAKVSANRKSGFSIVKYTGNSTANATVPHGLSAKVEFSIVKALNDSQAWSVYHKDAGGGLVLNLTNAAGSGYDHSASGDNLVSFSSSWDGVNGNYNYIMYAWHSVAGYSKFGSYVGNGSTDGPFVELGFRPAWVMTKNIDISTSAHWTILDNKRSGYNLVNAQLYSDLSIAEQNNSGRTADFLSNGFKIRGIDHNKSNNTHIYAAFAEAPFNAPATAR